MQFPFSFWGGNPFAGLIQTLVFFENFTNFFAVWVPVVQNLEFSENFTGFLNASWAPVVENLEFFEDFESGW